MAGVTIAGFVRKTEDECIDEIVTEAQATVDPEYDDSPDSATGQLALIVGSKWAESWEVLEAVWGALSEAASGVNLDRIAAITGTLRKVTDGDPDIIESDVLLRIRRRAEIPDAGSTTVDALRAALSKLSGVIAVRVFSNRTMVTDGAGRPAKSVEAVVLGGTAQTIADTIWADLTAGIEAYGTSSAISVTDEEGHTQTVKYSPATLVSLYVRVTAEVDEALYAGDTTLKQAVVDFTTGAVTLETSDGKSVAGIVDIGTVLYRTRIAAIASTVPGVTGVTKVEFSTNGSSWVDADWTFGPREILGHDTSVRGFLLARVSVVTT